MECFVEAIDENEAMEKYSNGGTTSPEYVEFINIEKVEK
jgi:hypothetical protein